MNEQPLISNEHIAVYPTVFDQYLNVESNESLKNLNVFITDLQGKLVFKKLINGNAQINLSKFTAGCYIMKIENSERKNLFQGKIIKSNK